MNKDNNYIDDILKFISIKYNDKLDQDYMYQTQDNITNNIVIILKTFNNRNYISYNDEKCPKIIKDMYTRKTNNYRKFRNNNLD